MFNQIEWSSPSSSLMQRCRSSLIYTFFYRVLNKFQLLNLYENLQFFVSSNLLPTNFWIIDVFFCIVCVTNRSFSEIHLIDYGIFYKNLLQTQEYSNLVFLDNFLLILQHYKIPSKIGITLHKCDVINDWFFVAL